MILNHIGVLIDKTPGHGTHILFAYIELVTFSGYLFAFGMGVGLSQRSAAKLNIAARIRAPLVLFVAYCMSSFAFLLLMSGSPIGVEEALDVILLRRLYGFSEFLASFFVISLVTSFMRRAVFWACDRNWMIVLLSTLSAALACMGLTASHIPLLNTLVGAQGYATYPVLRYLPWFMIGVCYTRRGAHIPVAGWLIAFTSSASCLGYALKFHTFPVRFPPDLLWIAGPAFFLLLYLLISQKVAKNRAVPGWILSPGRHVLYFLVASNIVLFIFASSCGKLPMNIELLAGFTLVLMFAIGTGRNLQDT